MRSVLHVVGARPNFPKFAPVWKALDGRARQVFVHTGQHYDDNMSRVFLETFELPQPDYSLGIGSGSHATQTAAVMTALEPIVEHEHPDVVMVYGDVNSTAAAALVVSKLGIGLAHVEAGLRSRDRTMPEELNRLVTDVLSDWLFAPSRDAVENLRREGVAGSIHFVGNVMIDTLAAFRDRLQPTRADRYVVATLHRPSNVDERSSLLAAIGALKSISAEVPVVLVVHPRTRTALHAHSVDTDGIDLIEPLGYIEFLSLVSGAAVVLTDSGGIQEETTWLGVPCVTMRTSTERPITVTEGTNVLAGNDPIAVTAAVLESLDKPRTPRRPDGWDGHAAQRIADVIAGETRPMR